MNATLIVRASIPHLPDIKKRRRSAFSEDNKKAENYSEKTKLTQATAKIRNKMKNHFCEEESPIFTPLNDCKVILAFIACFFVPLLSMGLHTSSKFFSNHT
jgi:hypothetical protein